MKQPALGKKISELRKQKGLTQEELVEMCSINVRTIQRIESGETTPRPFTIKTILEALGEHSNLDAFAETVIVDASARSLLNRAWIFGIIYFVMGFLETMTDMYQWSQDDSIFNTVSYITIKTVVLASFTLFFLGFVKIGKIYSQKLLEIISYVFIGAYIISVAFDLMYMQGSEMIIASAVVVKSIVFGTIQLVFGFSLLALRKHLGAIVTVTAILEIIVGAFFATVLLASLGLVLLIPLVIFEILVVYRVYTKAS